MLKGSIPALVTPFKDGKVDVDALKRLVDWHVEQGSHGLVPVGTTGESPTLLHEEHELVVKTVVEHAAGQIKIVAGSGSNNTVEALHFTQFAKDTGADAALVVTPYYNKPTQQGLIAHFLAVADVGLPIIIYNIPGRSAVDMAPATMAELAKHEMIVGVKDATGDLARVAWQRDLCGRDFIQLSGEDPTAHGFNAMGGVGCISVTANVAPALCSQVQEATLAGDYGRALDLQDRLMPLHRAVFMEPGVAGAKYGMAKLGLIAEDVRLPLMPLADDTRAAMDAAMTHAGLIN